MKESEMSKKADKIDDFFDGKWSLPIILLALYIVFSFKFNFEIKKSIQDYYNTKESTKNHNIVVESVKFDGMYLIDDIRTGEVYVRFNDDIQTLKITIKGNTLYSGYEWQLQGIKL